MATGRSLSLRWIGRSAPKPVTAQDRKVRDRSLSGKARIKARKAARR